MRNVLCLVLLIAVVSLSSAMPKSCRGGSCRNLRPAARPLRASGIPVPVSGIPRNLPLAVARRPAPLQTLVPVVNVPVTKLPARQFASVTEMKMVTDADGKEVREAGVNGWLSEPTPAPVNPATLARTEPPAKAAKPGSCDTPKGFGIKCMDRLDQCTIDNHCPGTTKCCMVGECGYLCVKPKPVSTEPKEVTKPVPNKKNKGDKNKPQTGEVLTTEASEITEVIELPEGAVKTEDIIEMTDDMKKEAAATKAEEERVEGEEQQKGMRMIDEEVEKDMEKEVVTEAVEEMEKEVVTEAEEEIEEVTEEILEEIEATTQMVLEGEEETPSEE